MSKDLIQLILIIAVPVIVMLFIEFIISLNEFRTELRYINNEINRTDGKEREHWVKQRRRLWLSLLPFVRY